MKFKLLSVCLLAIGIIADAQAVIFKREKYPEKRTYKKPHEDTQKHSPVNEIDQLRQKQNIKSSTVLNNEQILIALQLINQRASQSSR